MTSMQKSLRLASPENGPSKFAQGWLRVRSNVGFSLADGPGNESAGHVVAAARFRFRRHRGVCCSPAFVGQGRQYDSSARPWVKDIPGETEYNTEHSRQYSRRDRAPAVSGSHTRSYGALILDLCTTRFEDTEAIPPSLHSISASQDGVLPLPRS